MRLIAVFLFITGLFANTIDKNASYETKQLYKKLLKNSGKEILYGEFCNTKKINELETYKITGKYPYIFSCDYDCTVDVTAFKFIENKDKIIFHYNMGGIITLSWCMINFYTNGTSKDKTGEPITSILPNGSNRNKYLTALDKFANDIKDIKIPILFRPFHESDGGWFWWGNISCTDEQFIVLWRDLVNYLRDVKQVHNLIYVFNPQIHTSPTYKIGRFPGKDWVDVYGVDDYSNANDISAVMDLYRVTAIEAISDGKIFAITEGMRKLSDYPKADYWTWYFNQILNDPYISKVSYVCTWSSPNWGCQKGRSDESSFLEMSSNKKIKLLEYNYDILFSKSNTKWLNSK